MADPEADEVVSAAERLVRITELAELLHGGMATVRRRRDEQIRDAYAERDETGVKVTELAAAAGLSTQRVWQVLAEKDSPTMNIEESHDDHRNPPR